MVHRIYLNQKYWTTVSLLPNVLQDGARKQKSIENWLQRAMRKM